MTYIEVAQLDLTAMTKQELRSYAKKARQIWGESIDLRKANEFELVQYLENYQAWAARIASIAEKMVEEESVGTDVEPTPAEQEPAINIQTTEAYRGCGIYIAESLGGFTARVRDLDSEIDLTVEAPTKEEAREQAQAAIDAIFAKMIEAETSRHDLPDFENGEFSVSCLIEVDKWYPHCHLSDKALLTAQFHYNQQVADIHDRALLMARAEGESLGNCPDLGEEIYWLWVEGMDASDPRNYWLDSWHTDLGAKYQINSLVVAQLFESVRLIIVRYDALIDQIPSV